MGRLGSGERRDWEGAAHREEHCRRCGYCVYGVREIPLQC